MNNYWNKEAIYLSLSIIKILYIMKNNKHNFKSWLLATRPWSFPASSMPIVATIAFLHWSGNAINWGIGLWTLITIVVFHAAGNTWSDYFDFKKGVDREDTIGGTSMTSGEFQPYEIKRLASILLAVAVISGLGIMYFTGLTTLYFGLAGCLLTLLYPMLKYNALGDLDIFLTYSLLPILGTSYVTTGAIDYNSLWLVLPIGLITVGILHINNSRDIEHDKRAGIHTFAMLMGKRASALIYCLEVLLPFAWIIGCVVYGSMPVWSLLVLIALKPAVDNAKKAITLPKKGLEAVCGLDEATAKLQLMFSLLLTISLFISSWV